MELHNMTDEQLEKKKSELYDELAELQSKMYPLKSKIEDIEILQCERKKSKEYAEKGMDYYECMDSCGRLPCDPHYGDSNYDINGDYVGV